MQTALQGYSRSQTSSPDVWCTAQSEALESSTNAKDTVRFALIGDLQAPYHDRRAVEVACQVIEDFRPDVLVLNGDLGDYRAISRYPIFNKDERLISELRDEIKRTRELIHSFVKRVKPKKMVWHDGNHEWRIFRSLEKIPQALQLLGIEEVGAALSIPNLMQLDKLPCKYHYPGPYPNGSWLHPGLEPDKNVWVEHGYVVSKKAGYTAARVMADRMTSVVVNHVERLSLAWTRALGRDFFAIENGNLSVIAEDGLGEGIYGGVPHSVPNYMSHRQGFSLISYEGKQWWPELVKIRDGKAVYGGKVYR